MKSVINRIISDAKIDELADKFEDDLGRIRVNRVFDFAYAVIEEYEKLKLEKSSALERYNKLGVNEEETSPIERLRVYCSLAMSGKDWLDVEPFFDALPEGFEWKSIEDPDAPVIGDEVVVGGWTMFHFGKVFQWDRCIVSGSPDCPWYTTTVGNLPPNITHWAKIPLPKEK